MSTKIIKTFSCFFMLLPLCSFAYQQPLPQSTTYQMDKFSISAGIGYLGGQSNEYVYEQDGSKLSELNWKIQGASVIKGEMNVDFLPWFSANMNGWTTMGTNNAQMNDYDWLDPQQSNWTDWSHHPDTDLNYANNIDLNVRGWLLQNQSYKLGATVGYQLNEFDFIANGGCYNYGNGSFTGCFPTDQPGIGYYQTFDSVYLGLVGKYRTERFELNATLKVSPWVHANDVDEHYARGITFTESGDNSQFTSATLNAGYYFRQHAKIFFEAEYNQYTNGKADTTYTDRYGDVYYASNAAGLDNHNYVLSVGIQYKPYA